MRVLIDTTYAERAALSGTGVYIARICAELAGLREVDLVPVANPHRRAPAGGGRGSLHNLLADVVWSAVELPRRARQMRADLIHHPLPAIAPATRISQVVTVHDLAFERLPECFDPRFRLFAHHAHRLATRRANAVICVSETTAQDVRALWKVPPRRVVIAPHGPGQQPVASPREPRHFLYVGDEEPRKNLAMLLSAYKLYRAAAPLPLPLVLAGSTTAHGAGVSCEHRPSPERLAELYAEAVALVHPSLYEGFGLTVLEAMSAGTAVIASDASGVAEIAADAVRYADPRDATSFASAMLEVAQSAALRQELSARGRRRAASYSWSASAHAHITAYSLALSA